MVFPSHGALLSCVLAATLPEIILIFSTKAPRLLLTLPQNVPNINLFPGGLTPSWRKPWSDTRMSLFSYVGLAYLHPVRTGA